MSALAYGDPPHRFHHFACTYLSCYAAVSRVVAEGHEKRVARRLWKLRSLAWPHGKEFPSRQAMAASIINVVCSAATLNGWAVRFHAVVQGRPRRAARTYDRTRSNELD